MIFHINLPEYEKEGLRLEWEENSILSVIFDKDENTLAIGGNREGLISLARHLLTLAQENVPIGYHIHLDDQNSLEAGSCELIIGKNLI